MKEMMEWVMSLGFCADDMRLYLDTHPEDADALEYYNQCTELYKKAKMNYESQYGPISWEGGMTKKQMRYGAPMPWEGDQMYVDV